MPEFNGGYAYRCTAQRAYASLLEFLSQKYTHSSPEVWRSRLENGEISIDGFPLRHDMPLRQGQVVVWQRPPWAEEDVPLAFEVIYQDNDLLAVNKPSGLPTVPAGGFLEHTLLTQVRRRWPTASPLHRLGRGTSGLVLFGLHPQAGAAVLRDWRLGQVEKLYLAQSQGVAAQDLYDIRTPIGPVPHPKLGEVFAASPAGKPAHSLARVLEREKKSTTLEVCIYTGRPHQIRIHLASVGLPLLGDPLYTVGGEARPDGLPGDLGYRLHAHKLRLRHPRTGEWLELSAQSEWFAEP